MAWALSISALGAGCFSVKIDTTDTLTTFVSLSDVLSDSITATLTDTSTASTTTDPTTTTIDPTTTTTIDPTTTTTIDPSDTVTTIPPPPTCGDGIVAGGEGCDDGNQNDSDACLNTCVPASCGDGFVRLGVEACDDGVNDNSYNGCAPGCLELGPRCGDGAVQGPEGEECDDGNATPGDGCTGCKVDAQVDECDDAVDLTEADRNVASGADVVECDLELPQAGQWSRFTGAAGTKMPTTAPPEFACGTHAPGWLNGQEPAQADGIVDREVCFHWEGEDCHFKVPIKVRNCGAFLVYRLQPVPTCALRYCGAN